MKTVLVVTLVGVLNVVTVSSYAGDIPRNKNEHRQRKKQLEEDRNPNAATPAKPAQPKGDGPPLPARPAQPANK
jgi:hypothetical protein